MRPAGRFVAEVLQELRAQVDVGVNLLELDELAHKMITDRGAESCYIDYHPSFGASPFGKVLCKSVHDTGVPRPPPPTTPPPPRPASPTTTSSRTAPCSASTSRPASTAGCPTQRSASWSVRRTRATWS